MTKPVPLTIDRRRFAIIRLSPPAPPCFESRTQWLEYLHACDDACHRHADAEPGPLVLDHGIAFNPAFSICKDCDKEYAEKMAKAGRCEPGYLAGLKEGTL
jgi:hypothetical protein